MQDECKGGFLFISHSHKDMDRVRQLRNKLEEAGYEPLCFYLKALDGSEEELDDLIKREIDARQWFVYAVSTDSRDSEWVQKERDWRKRPESRNKQELKVSLESDFSVDEFLRNLTRKLRVNIIYSHEDLKFVNRLACKLKQRDLQVTGVYNGIIFDEDIEQRIRNDIENANKSGTNIAVLSRNSIDSWYFKNAVSYAFNRGSNITPLFIDDVELEGRFKLYFMNVPGIMSRPIKDENDLDDFVNDVVDEISAALESYNFIDGNKE